MSFDRDPIQGLIDLVLDVKPYHTKIVDVFIEYAQDDLMNLTITDAIEFEITSRYEHCPIYRYIPCVPITPGICEPQTGVWTTWEYLNGLWQWVQFIPFTSSQQKFDILSTDASSKIITIAGDHVSTFPPRTRLNIIQSTTNDKDHIVAEVNLVLGNTEIRVFKTIFTTVTDGIILRENVIGDYWENVQNNMANGTTPIDGIGNTRQLFKYGINGWAFVTSIISNATPKMPDPHGTIIYTNLTDTLEFIMRSDDYMALEDDITVIACDYPAPWGGGIRYDFVIDVPSDVITIAGNQIWPHSVLVGEQILFNIDAGGSLPIPITINTPYYIIPVTPNSFKIAATKIDAINNVPITITSGGNMSYINIITGIPWDNCGWDTHLAVSFFALEEYFSDAVDITVSELMTSDGSAIFGNTVQTSSAQTSFVEDFRIYMDVLELFDSIGPILTEIVLSTTQDNPDVASLIGSWDGTGFDTGGWAADINSQPPGSYPPP